jgi:hypothetical protein
MPLLGAGDLLLPSAFSAHPQCCVTYQGSIALYLLFPVAV